MENEMFGIAMRTRSSLYARYAAADSALTPPSHITRASRALQAQDPPASLYAQDTQASPSQTVHATPACNGIDLNQVENAADNRLAFEEPARRQEAFSSLHPPVRSSSSASSASSTIANCDNISTPESPLSDVPSDIDAAPPSPLSPQHKQSTRFLRSTASSRGRRGSQPSASISKFRHLILKPPEHVDGERPAKRVRKSPKNADDGDEDSGVSVTTPVAKSKTFRAQRSPILLERDSAQVSASSPLISPLTVPVEREGTCLQSNSTYAERRKIRIEAVNRQQTRLLQEDRVKALNSRFKRAKSSLPSSFYASMSEMASYIIDHGQAAQSHLSPSEADFLAFNNREYKQWLDEGTGDKVVILRDRATLNDRPYVSSKGVLDELLQGDPKTIIDAQDLGESIVVGQAVKRMGIEEAIKRMSVYDETVAPVNCLDIACTSEITPAPLKTRCCELPKAARYVDTQANRHLKDRLSGIGKKKAETKHTHAIDINQCMTFQIIGQAGSFSSWHMDNMGVGTFVTLEPNCEKVHPQHTWRTEEAENEEAAHYDQFFWKCVDEEVLKLWAVVRMDHLSEDSQQVHLKAFRKEGVNWRPPGELIRIIALIRGDTLIMPPGTIHAPITVTNCLFRGGMVMQKSNLRRTFAFWRYVSENPHCTNEEKPKETRAVVDYLQNLVHREASACGFTDDYSLEKFDEDCRVISGAALSCDCSKNECKPASCGCQRYGQRCGPACHATRKHASDCLNPFGNEATKKIIISP